MKKLLILLILLLIALVSTAHGQSKVYVGGTNGITSLLDSENSDTYRKNGGGLFIHNSGWSTLDEQQRVDLLQIFKDGPIAIELGYNKSNPTAWVVKLRDTYIKHGVKPHFIICDVFANNNIPTQLEWKDLHTQMQEISPKSLILPTFEYANFGKNRATLAKHLVSRDKRFKQIIKQSKGMAIDVPPNVYLTSTDSYRAWIIDAIKYANKANYLSVLIISPHDSRDDFKKHTDLLFKDLRKHNVNAKVVVVENYTNHGNKIGNEDNVNSVLGVASYITRKQKK